MCLPSTRWWSQERCMIIDMYVCVYVLPGGRTTSNGGTCVRPNWSFDKKARTKRQKKLWDRKWSNRGLGDHVGGILPCVIRGCSEIQRACKGALRMGQRPIWPSCPVNVAAPATGLGVRHLAAPEEGWGKSALFKHSYGNLPHLGLCLSERVCTYVDVCLPAWGRTQQPRRRRSATTATCWASSAPTPHPTTT